MSNTLKKKLYNTPPLPFQGNKSFFIKEFRSILKHLKTDTYTIVDVFGGSGLLARNAKDTLPSSTVIYNDYDDYRTRIEGIDKTNELIEEINNIIASYQPVKPLARLPSELSTDIKALLTYKYMHGEFIDYLTLTSPLIFSSHFIKDFQAFIKNCFYCLYNNNFISPYTPCPDYLSGLNVVKLDYKQLIDRYKDTDNVIFVLDPPYLKTNTENYNFNYTNLLKLNLNLLYLMQNMKFIYFSSTKSEMLIVSKWLKEKFLIDIFHTSFITSRLHTVKSGISYTDYLIHNLDVTNKELPFNLDII